MDEQRQISQLAKVLINHGRTQLHPSTARLDPPSLTFVAQRNLFPTYPLDASSNMRIAWLPMQQRWDIRGTFLGFKTDDSPLEACFGVAMRYAAWRNRWESLFERAAFVAELYTDDMVMFLYNLKQETLALGTVVETRTGGTWKHNQDPLVRIWFSMKGGSMWFGFQEPAITHIWSLDSKPLHDVRQKIIEVSDAAISLCKEAAACFMPVGKLVRMPNGVPRALSTSDEVMAQTGEPVRPEILAWLSSDETATAAVDAPRPSIASRVKFTTSVI